MKYQCGHNGCDICGGRECAGLTLQRIDKYMICEYCLNKAVETAYEMACRFGGAIIDVSKPCGYEDTQKFIFTEETKNN